MTSSQERQVLELKREGLGDKRIADATGLKPEMVKSFLRRKKQSDESLPCEYCGKQVIQTPHRKKKRFCDSRCRASWWREHPQEINRKQYQHLCKWCGASFLSTRSAAQYCSRRCYAVARRKENCAGVWWASNENHSLPNRHVNGETDGSWGHNLWGRMGN